MKHTQTLSMLITLSAVAGLAIAQPAKKESTDNDLLRGPAVTETDAPNADKRERPEIDVEAALEERPMELREVSMAIRNLGSDRMQVSLGLTKEQSEKIKAITQKYREDIRAYQQENQAEFRKLREEMRAEGEKMREQRQKERDAEPMSDEPMSDKAPERPQETDAARKMREFLANAPATKAAMKSIRDVLGEEQMELIKKHVVVSRQRQQERAAQRGSQGPRGAQRRVDSDEARPERRERDTDRRTKPNKEED
jgi:hypothetical protein